MTFREWLCDVTISESVGTVHTVVGAKVLLTEVGEVTLSLRLSGQLHIASFPEQQSINGREHSGLTVNAEGVRVQRTRFDSTANESIIVFVAPEILLARTQIGPVTEQHIYFKGIHVLGPCAFSDGTTSYTLEQLPKRRDDSRAGRILSILKSNTERSFRDVQVLLGLAQRCRARAPYRECYDSSGLCSVTLIHEDTAASAGHPLVPPRGKDTADFMNAALRQYSQTAGSLELPRLIDYYCLSIEASFHELKFILAGVFMEALKFYWAKNVKGYPSDKKANGLIRGFEKAKAPNGRSIHYTFEELIVATYGHYGLNPMFTFIEDRNALFHTGAPGAAQTSGGPLWPAIRPELERLYRQIDEFLLTILGYSGLVRRWEAPDQDVTFP